MNRPTLDDVAEAAGVSIATASKALRSRPDVSTATSHRVLQAAKQLGYHPRSRTTDHPVIAVAFDTIDNFYSPQILEGMLRAAAECAVQVQVTTHESRISTLEPGTPKWLAETLVRGISAVVLVNHPLTPERAIACHQHGIRLALIDPIISPDTPQTLIIAADNMTGARQATEHLIGLGHRRIAMVTGPQDSLPAQQRTAGFMQALRAAGVALEDDLVVDADFRYEGGLAAGRYLLELPEPPTAIFAQCDVMAFGAIEAARRRHLQVPADLSIVGFDDGYATRHCAPPLTTVRQPLHQMGHLAIQELAAAIHDDHAPALLTALTTRLVLRSSTAAPRHGRGTPATAQLSQG